MSSFSKSASLTFLTQIPTQVLGITSGIFITRILGPEGKGIYAIFYADVNLFITLLGFSLTTAIIQFTASKRMTEEKLMGITLLFSILTVLLSIGLLFIWLSLPIADLLFPSSHITYQYILWFVLFILITQVNTVYSGFFQGAKRFDVVNRVSLINSIANIALFGTAFTLHYNGIKEIGLFEILLIALAVLIFNTLQWHIHFKKTFKYSFNLKLKWKEDIKSFFQFMGLGHLSNIINFLNYRMVLWIIAFYLDNAQVGIFSLAAGLSQLLYFISTPLSQVLMPFLSAESTEGRKTMFVRFARIHFSVIIVIACFAAALAPIFIPLLYGSLFNDSVMAFELILLGIVLSCQTKIFASYFVAANRMDINLYATLIGFAVTFVFNFTLIQLWGINGASIAQTITYFSIFLFVFLALVTFGKVGSLNLFFINKDDIKYARSKLKRKPR
jgi:O-antigen/teichoic acid export membrane protein